uniref:C-type lectin domain-containing protein n=1 Tax=Oryzias sinensis TaxID=183150 RepID=A0A8C7XNW2_9TELE
MWSCDQREDNTLEHLLPEIFLNTMSGNVLETALRSVSEYHCDPGYLLYGNYCYHLESEDVKSWQDAEDHCSRQQGHLASIHSQEECHSACFVSAAHMVGQAWVGLNDIKSENQFVYTDGTPVTFTYWAPGEPNNHNGFSEDCVEMLYETGRWNDKSCSELNNYICKKPKAHYPAPSVQPTQYGCPQVGEAKCFKIFVSLKLKTL